MKDVDTRAAISAAKKGGRFIPAHLVNQVEAILDRRPPDPTAADSRPEPATSAQPALPTIRLGEPGEPTYIDGRPIKAKTLNKEQHAIVSLLLDAGPEGLFKGQIEAKSKFSGWRRLQAPQ